MARFSRKWIRITAASHGGGRYVIATWTYLSFGVVERAANAVNGLWVRSPSAFTRDSPIPITFPCIGPFARVAKSGAPQGLLRCERERKGSPSLTISKLPHYSTSETSANDQDIDMRLCTDGGATWGPICMAAGGSTSGRDGVSPSTRLSLASSGYRLNSFES